MIASATTTQKPVTSHHPPPPKRQRKPKAAPTERELDALAVLRVKAMLDRMIEKDMARLKNGEFRKPGERWVSGSFTHERSTLEHSLETLPQAYYALEMLATISGTERGECANWMPLVRQVREEFEAWQRADILANGGNPCDVRR